MNALNVVVPLISVLIGAALTYWLNVRTRRQTFVEDLFNEAIAAVAVADASQHYMSKVAKPQAMNDEQYRELLAQIAKTAIENHTRSAAEAQIALARVVQFAPEFKLYYSNGTAVIEQPNEIITQLIEARDEHIRRRWTHHRLNPAKGSQKELKPVSETWQRPFGAQFATVVRHRPSRSESTATGPGLDSDSID